MARFVGCSCPKATRSGIGRGTTCGTRLCEGCFFSVVTKRNRYFAAEEHFHFHNLYGSRELLARTLERFFLGF